MSNFFAGNHVLQTNARRPNSTMAHAPASMHQVNAARQGLPMPNMSTPTPTSKPAGYPATPNMFKVPPPPPRKPSAEKRVVQQGFDQQRMEYVFKYSDGSMSRVAKHIHDAKQRGKRDLATGLIKNNYYKFYFKNHFYVFY